MLRLLAWRYPYAPLPRGLLKRMLSIDEQVHENLRQVIGVAEDLRGTDGAVDGDVTPLAFSP
jgi:hypothetical protein